MQRRCVYEFREDRIHQLTLLESSEAAVDQWIAYLDRICTTEDQTPMLLIDFTKSGVPPVNYFISRVNEWRQARPDARLGFRAVLYRGTGMTLELLENMAHLLDFFQSPHTQFFQGKHQAQALAWLRDSQAPACV